MSLGLVALLFLVIMIGMGVIQQQLGKKNCSQTKGLILPIGYSLFRLFLSAATGGNNLGMTLLSGALISYIYYAIFDSAKKKAVKKAGTTMENSEEIDF